MERALIIAEMAWAHDGQLEKAINIMRAAKQAGADAIGVHVTDMPNYMVPHYGSGEGRVSAGKEHLEIYKYLQQINLTNDDWTAFSEAARKEQISLCVMPNDQVSLDFCESALKPDYYVLSAACFVEADFVAAVAKTGRHTILRIGGATIGEIEKTLSTFFAHDGGKVTLLHGIQNYPTKLEDTNIRQMQTLHTMFGVSVGLADHIDGADPVARALPLLALALGASCIEKHITWNRAERGEDFEAALDPKNFAEFVRFVRAGEIALGTAAWATLSDAAGCYRLVSRKRMVAAKSIKAGSVLSREDVTFKRSDVGLSPELLDSVVGRTIRTDLTENDGITFEDML
jgi:sialic acid synthase SpsE